MNLFVGGGLGWQKVVAVAHGLYQHKGAIEHQRNDGHKGQLAGAVDGADHAGGVVGQHQGQHRNGSQRGERGAHAQLAKGLLAVAAAARQQADAHNAVQDQHHRSKHGVARQSCGLRAAGQHHGNNQRHLDDGNGEGQHQRAIGLAHLVRHHLGMVHGGEHRTHQTGSQQRHPPATGQAKQAARQQHPAYDGPGHRPKGEGGLLLHGRSFTKKAGQAYCQ